MAIPEYTGTFMRSSEFYLKFTEGSKYKQSYKGIFIAGSYKHFSAALAAADPATLQTNPAVKGEQAAAMLTTLYSHYGINQITNHQLNPAL